MARCNLCASKTPDDELIQEICIRCRAAQALVPRTEPLRPRIPCARCHHTSFVRCHAIRERSFAQLFALPATYATKVVQTGFRDGAIQPDLDQPIGTYETYICRGCGFVEWYACDAAEIPIGPEHATELFELEPRGVYR